MYCSECGAALGADGEVCEKCGTIVPSASQPTDAGPGAPDASPVPAAAASAFRDPSRLTQWLRYCLYVSIAIDVIAVFSGILQFTLLMDFESGGYASPALATAAAQTNDSRQQIIGVFQLGIAIPTIILFCRWIYRANFNARQLGAQGMKFSPGWSVGYYFIPILLLWKPYQAMKEIWQASKNPASWATVKRGSILPWWWFFFLVAGLFEQASLRFSLQSKDITYLIGATCLTLASDFLTIPAAILALVLVKQIYAMQMSHVPPPI
jgi:hypothetical protein